MKLADKNMLCEETVKLNWRVGWRLNPHKSATLSLSRKRNCGNLASQWSSALREAGWAEIEREFRGIT